MQAVEIDGVAVLDPTRFELGKDAVFAQCLIKEHTAFVVGEVDVCHQPLQPLARDVPHTVLDFDLQRLVRVDDRRARDVFGLIDRHRWQLRELLRDLEHQLPRAVVARGGEGKDREAQRLHVLAQRGEQAVVHHDVRLVRDDDLRARSQLRRPVLQLSVDGVKVRDRIAALAARHVHDVDEQPAAVDVS